MAKNKEGMGNVTKVILGILVVLFVISFVLAAFRANDSGEDFLDALTESIKSVFTKFAEIIGYLLNAEGENSFIMVISFIMIAVIIIATLDSANIFGEDNWVVNFVVGIIVAIIGVRFMPSDLWASLVAPSNALAATALVGGPFALVVIITMAIRSRLASKVIWIFFISMVTYLVFRQENSFRWVYLTFLIASAIMMVFDGTIRSLVRKEKEEHNLENTLDLMGVKDRYKIREEIKELNNVLIDTGASPADKVKARKELSDLRKAYGQDLSRI